MDKGKRIYHLEYNIPKFKIVCPEWYVELSQVGIDFKLYAKGKKGYENNSIISCKDGFTHIFSIGWVRLASSTASDTLKSIQPIQVKRA